RADEAIFLWGYKSKLGRLLRGFGILSQCLTSSQPLAMTETTMQPRFITRLPPGASLRGGSRRSRGSDKDRCRISYLLIQFRSQIIKIVAYTVILVSRAVDVILLWEYKSKLGRLLRGFGILSQCLTSFQPLAMTETTLKSRVHKLLLQNPLHIIHHLRGGFLDIERFEFLMGNTKDNRGIGRAIGSLVAGKNVDAVLVLHFFGIGPWVI